MPYKFTPEGRRRWSVAQQRTYARQRRQFPSRVNSLLRQAVPRAGLPVLEVEHELILPDGRVQFVDVWTRLPDGREAGIDLAVQDRKLRPTENTQRALAEKKALLAERGVPYLLITYRDANGMTVQILRWKRDQRGGPPTGGGGGGGPPPPDSASFSN